MLPFLQVSDVPVKPTLSIVQQAENSAEIEVPKTYTLPTIPIEYTVVEGDNLTKISLAHNTSVQRLWEKNLQLTNPDVINVGDKLVIPKDDEVLTTRELPKPVIIVTVPTSVSQPTTTQPVRELSSPRGAVSGNTYTRGYCTWYVKNRRPDLPNNLGNADTWYARYPGAKGTTPQAGAAAQARGQMHVVYVESVNSDGTVNISEMNYKGWNVISYRTAPASSFYYMY